MVNTKIATSKHISVTIKNMNKHGFGDWLIDELKRKDVSQADLARAVGIGRSSISLLVSGRNSPSHETCSRIAAYFGIPEIEVLRAAGIATARPTKSPFIEFMEDAGEKLSEEEQIDIMDNVRAKLLRKQRSKDAV